MEYDEERKIRDQERRRAVEIIVKYHDGSEGALINMRTGIYEGWKINSETSHNSRKNQDNG